MIVQRCIVNNAVKTANAFGRRIYSVRGFRSFGTSPAQTNQVTRLIKSTRLPSIKTFCTDSKSFENDEHDSAKNDSQNQLREQILETALTLVHKHGWSVESISLACEQLGYSSVTHGLFPNGSIDLVMYFIDKCNRQLFEQVMSLNLEEMTLKEKLYAVTKLRLEMIAPFISSWSQALGQFAQVSQAPTAVQTIGTVSDQIWMIVGDTSTQFDWYTKRVAVAGIYSTTEMHMLTDHSPNFSDTWRFLQRRIDDAVSLHEATIEVQKTINLFTTGAFTFVNSRLGMFKQ